MARNHLLVLFVLFISLNISAQTIRNFSTSTIDNKPVSYSDIKGEYLTVLDFWASWCRPCLKAMPKLQNIYQEYNHKGVAFIGVNTDGPRSFSKVLPLVNSLNITYPNIRDIEGKIKDELEVSSMPTFLIINKEDIVVFRHEGFASGDEEEWRKVIEKLLAE
ncbi:TlpA family protein disulfide reductase [Saccharicrinis sp. 156]|uniref:TlpA family protein disulfide reductase n=1 Tax=Saccharicrinis sp. 156 TaxID=3417574 RepID=UPI003D325BE6